MVSYEKSTVIQMGVLLWVMCSFSLTIFKVVFLYFYFKIFNYDVSWHGFILFEVYLVSCFYKFVSFTKFVKFSTMISSKTLSAPLSSTPGVAVTLFRFNMQVLAYFCGLLFKRQTN